MGFDDDAYLFNYMEKFNINDQYNKYNSGTNQSYMQDALMGEESSHTTIESVFTSYSTLSQTGNQTMDSARFFKLCYDSLLLDKRFRKNDVDIVFIKYRDAKTKSLDFLGFKKALDDVAERKASDIDTIKQLILIANKDGLHITGSRAEKNRFHDDASTWTGVHARGGMTIIDNSATTFFSPIAAHNLIKGHDKRGAALNTNEVIPERYMKQKPSERANSAGPRGRSAESPAEDYYPTQGSSSKYRRTRSMSPTALNEKYKIALEALRPKQKTNKFISVVETDDKTRETARYYFDIYANPPGCHLSDGMEGMRFRRFVLDNRKLLVDTVKFKRTEIDIIFTKFRDAKTRKLSFDGFMCCLDFIAQRRGVGVAKVLAVIAAKGKTEGPIKAITKTLANRFHDDKTTYTGIYKAGGPSVLDANSDAFWGHNGVIDSSRLFDKNYSTQSASRSTPSNATLAKAQNVKKAKNDDKSAVYDKKRLLLEASVKKEMAMSKQSTPSGSSSGEYGVGSGSYRYIPSNVSFFFEKYCSTQTLLSQSQFLDPAMDGVGFYKFCKDSRLIDGDGMKVSDVDKLYMHSIGGSKVRRMNVQQFLSAVEILAELNGFTINTLMEIIKPHHTQAPEKYQQYLPQTEEVVSVTQPEASADLSSPVSPVLGDMQAPVDYVEILDDIRRPGRVALSVMKGWMSKKSNKTLMGYQRRFCALMDNGFFAYYSKEKNFDNNDEANGTINLNGLDTDAVSWNMDRFSITDVKSGSRAYEFQCTSPDVAALWCKKVKEVINALR